MVFTLEHRDNMQQRIIIEHSAQQTILYDVICEGDCKSDVRHVSHKVLKPHKPPPCYLVLPAKIEMNKNEARHYRSEHVSDFSIILML